MVLGTSLQGCNLEHVFNFQSVETKWTHCQLPDGQKDRAKRDKFIIWQSSQRSELLDKSATTSLLSSSTLKERERKKNPTHHVQWPVSHASPVLCPAARWYRAICLSVRLFFFRTAQSYACSHAPLRSFVCSLAHSLPPNTIQYNTIQYNTIQYNTILCNCKPSLIKFSILVANVLLGSTPSKQSLKLEDKYQCINNH